MIEALALLASDMARSALSLCRLTLLAPGAWKLLRAMKAATFSLSSNGLEFVSSTPRAGLVKVSFSLHGKERVDLARLQVTSVEL